MDNRKVSCCKSNIAYLLQIKSIKLFTYGFLISLRGGERLNGCGAIIDTLAIPFQEEKVSPEEEEECGCG